MDRKDIKKGLELLSGISKSKKVKCAAAGAGVVAGILTGAYAAYKYVFHFIDKRDENDIMLPKGEQYDPMHEKMYSLVREMQEIPYEQVYITSFDGTKLAGKYYHISDEAPLQIQFHGYHGTGLRDFCGGHKIAREMGHNILVIDERAHGKSEGKYVGFGVLDRYDLLEWIRYVNKRFDNGRKIFLFGTSMGATTVLMASGFKEVQDCVKGIIADCAFTSPNDIFSHVLKKDYHLPPFPIMNINNVMCKKTAGYTFTEYSTLDALKTNKIPVLFIHGKEDKFVPTWMSEKNYEAAVCEKELLMVDGAGHGSSCYENMSLYQETEKKFISKCLGQ